MINVVFDMGMSNMYDDMIVIICLLWCGSD